MDYQAFNSQHPSFGGLPGTPVHAAQPSHSPQQHHQYADPHGRFLQSTPSPFAYAQQQQQQQQQFPNGQPAQPFPSMGGGGLMQPGGLSQSPLQNHQAHAHAHAHAQAQAQAQAQARAAALQQQHQLSSPSPYSSAPFSQPLASPANPQFAQHRQAPSPSSANSHASPYANPQPPQQSPGLVPSSVGQQHMTLHTSQPPASQPMQVQTPVKSSVPPSPASPHSQAREKERMTTLLEINSLLIKEVVDLQSQGKAGHVGPAPPAQDGKPEPEKSKEYVDCMRRLQSNLAYLAQNVDKNHKPNQPVLHGPAIMTTPAAPPELSELYTKLQGLFPGWKGQTAQMKASPGPQRLNSTSSNSSITMQPPNSAGLQNHMHPPNSAGLPPHMQQMPQQHQSPLQNQMPPQQLQ